MLLAALILGGDDVDDAREAVTQSPTREAATQLRVHSDWWTRVGLRGFALGQPHSLGWGWRWGCLFVVGCCCRVLILPGLGCMLGLRGADSEVGQARRLPEHGFIVGWQDEIVCCEGIRFWQGT